ncbi:MAG: DUF1566 domain-containing protein [Deltaproteobacteria bacterium]|nr:DUF1566 domain-containing protein [Deltaproteobacteria bacterium]
MQAHFFSGGWLRILSLAWIPLITCLLIGCAPKFSRSPDLNRFVPQGDWAVLDTQTGLFWEVKTWNNYSQALTWDEARAYCLNLKLGGYQDWRLPSPKELKSLFNPNFVPTLPPQIFKYPQPWCWSSRRDLFSSEA